MNRYRFTRPLLFGAFLLGSLMFAAIPAGAQSCATPKVGTMEAFVRNCSTYPVTVSWTPAAADGSTSVSLSQNQGFRADTNGDGMFESNRDKQWQENVKYTISITVGTGATPTKVVYQDCNSWQPQIPPPADPCTNTYWRDVTFVNGSKNDFFVTVNANGTLSMGHSSWSNNHFTSNPGQIRPGVTLWNLKYDFIPVTGLGFFSCLVQPGTIGGGGGGGGARMAQAPEALTDGSGLALAVEAPAAVELSNFPNPFNPSTEISFSLAEAARVTLVVYDVIGREVARLVDGERGAGSHQVRWEAGDLPSGLYLYRFTAGAVTQTKSMVLMK